MQNPSGGVCHQLEAHDSLWRLGLDAKFSPNFILFLFFLQETPGVLLQTISIFRLQ